MPRRIIEDLENILSILVTKKNEDLDQSFQNFVKLINSLNEYSQFEKYWLTMGVKKAVDYMKREDDQKRLEGDKKFLSRYLKILSSFAKSPEGLDVSTAKRLYSYMINDWSKTSLGLPFNVSPTLAKLYRMYPHIISKKGFKETESKTHYQELKVMQVSELGEQLVDLNRYIANRVPNSVFNLVKEFPQALEGFVGNEDDMKNYFFKCHPEYEYRGVVGHPKNSFLFHIFVDKKNPGNIKIVVPNIPSQSRLIHLAKFFQAGGLDIREIKYRGCFEIFAKEEIKKLEAFLDQLPNIPEVVFIGSDVMPRLSSFLKDYESDQNSRYTLTTKDPKGKKFKNNTLELDPQSHFKGSYRIVKSRKGKAFGAMSFRMPNGELSYYLMELLLKKRVQNIVLVGAGGQIFPEDPKKKEHQVGKYRIIHACEKDGERVYPLQKKNSLQDRLDVKSYVTNLRGDHTTVSSTLDESEEWLRQVRSKEFSSVDVETHHILRALNETLSKKEDANYEPEFVAGVFISDVVGDAEHSIAESITGDNAFKYVNNMVVDVFDLVSTNLSEAI